MDKNQIFQWLVDYHYQNLKLCLPYIVDGKVQVRGTPLEECYDENELYKGLLIVVNNNVIVDKLVEDGVVLSEPEQPNIVSTREEFFSLISRQKNSDGAYILDRVNQRITKVSELNNNPKALPKQLPIYNMVPKDFVSHTAKLDVRNIGTKTRLAIKLPHAYEDTDTFQIKRSAYTPLGLGKVTHFNKQGLVEEFFFRHMPEAKAPLIECTGIVGVYRKYWRDESGALAMISEEIIDKDGISNIDSNCCVIYGEKKS